MPDQNTGNLNLADAHLAVGEDAQVALGHGNTQVRQDVRGDRNITVGAGDLSIDEVVYGNKTEITNIIKRVIEQLYPNPYKLLDAYSLSDHGIFFGRKGFVEDFASHVGRSKLLVLLGPAGSGKSSLINAGLVPRLADLGYTPITFRDYTDPRRQLWEKLHQDGMIDVPREASLQAIFQSFKARQEAAAPPGAERGEASAEKTRLIVIFDQFERFVTRVPEATLRDFITQCKSCTEAFTAEEINFVFVLQDGFIGPIMKQAEAVEEGFLTQAFMMELKPFSLKDAREAIVWPLEKVEASIGYDPRFVDELARDLAEEHGLYVHPAHLQIVCTALYKQALARWAQRLPHGVVEINRAFYEEAGGVETILADFMEEEVAQIAQGSKIPVALVRRLIMEMVDATHEDASNCTRVFVSLEELCDLLPGLDAVQVGTLLRMLCRRHVVKQHYVVEQQRATYSLSHPCMAGRVYRWFDVRALALRRARMIVAQGQIAFEDWGQLFNVQEVAHIRRWVDDAVLSEEARLLLVRSETAHQEKTVLLQRFLREAGYDVSTNGGGLHETADALKDYQEKNGLPGTYVPDHRTWIKLASQFPALADTLLGTA